MSGRASASFLTTFITTHMIPFDNQDLTRLLLQGQADSHGAHHHLGWETYPGAQGGDADANLTTLHESFHNELNNLTAYGFLLQVYALLTKSDQQQENYREIFEYLVARCREAHEVYATFISTTITAEKKENEGKGPGELLKNYPTYGQHYEKGRILTADFQGNYLKEIALTAIIISCFQSRAICERARQDLAAFEPNRIDNAEFPDSRLSLLGRKLPPGYLRKSFEDFCQSRADDQGLDVFQGTEINPAWYQMAIKPEYDELQRSLIDHIVNDLAQWFENARLPCLPFYENLDLLGELFSRANALTDVETSGMQLVLNREPMNFSKNILVNFTNEKYTIRKEHIPAVMVALSEVPRAHWGQLTGGSGEEEHFFVLSRIGHRLLKQYDCSAENKNWLNERLNDPLVFLRRRQYSPDTKEELVQLYWIETPDIWLDFIAACPNVPIVSNISMHTWAIPDWESRWLNALTEHSQCTILFDLPPHNQLNEIFEPACDRVLINKVWIKHDLYNHCALVMQGRINGSDDRTPLFLLPASETTCNVISNYAMKHLKKSLFMEDKEFLYQQSWLVRVALGRLFNEESTFDFNTI